MESFDLGAFKRDVKSLSIGEYHSHLEKLCQYSNEINKVILDDFIDHPDIIKADILLKYVTLTRKSLRDKLSSGINDDAEFYLLLLLFKSGDISIIKQLLPYAESEDKEKSLQVINKLSSEGLPELKLIIERKLDSPDFSNQDYVLSILEAAKKMSLSLPDSFKSNLPENLNWSLKRMLEEDFGLLSR